jgi:hypothetical protein
MYSADISKGSAGIGTAISAIEMIRILISSNLVNISQHLSIAAWLNSEPSVAIKIFIVSPFHKLEFDYFF